MSTDKPGRPEFDPAARMASLQKTLAPYLASNAALGAELGKTLAPLTASNAALRTDLAKILAPLTASNAALRTDLAKILAPLTASNAAIRARLAETLTPLTANNAALRAQLAETLAPLASSNAALGAQWQKTVAPLLAASAAQTAQWQKTMGPILANLARVQRAYTDQWGQITAAFAQWDKAERELVAMLAPRGWLIAPDLPMSITPRLLRIRRERGLRALDESLMQMFSPAYCRRLVTATYSRPSFRQWRPTMNKAMSAHKRREFALAIPIWLMAIDGIARDELSRKAVFSNLGKTSRAQIAKSLETGGLRDILLDGWLDVMVGIAGNRPGASAVPVVVVNRHAVLHGHRPRVGGERDSIQCILVLHLLHYFLTGRESEAVA